MHQLISYIAPSAPATRRPAVGDEPFLRPEIGFTPAWYRQHLNIDFGERWHTDVAYRKRTVRMMRTELRRRFPGTRIGGIDQPDDGALDLLTGVFGATAVSAHFGLPIKYAPDNWPNVEHRYISVDEMRTLKVPDLDNSPFMQGLLEQIDRIAEKEGCCYGFVNWQGVINNAQRLRGPGLFTDMYDHPDVCHHFFDVICTVIIEATEAVRQRQRQSGVDYRFTTVSNCSVNMVSPELYENFLLPCDRRIAESSAAIGIHNCAWKADPYLELYASVPNLGYIDMGIDSDLAKARRLMPEARRALMYTPMDLNNKSEDEIRADLNYVAENYAPCDIVAADIEADTPDERVCFLHALCRELSATGA